MAVSITLEDDIDTSRSDMIAGKGCRVRLPQDVDAMVCRTAERVVATPGRCR